MQIARSMTDQTKENIDPAIKPYKEAGEILNYNSQAKISGDITRYDGRANAPVVFQFSFG